MAVKDPVCNMSVDDTSAAPKSGYNGTTYYFCSAGCKQKFDSDPASYAEPKQKRGGC